MSISECFSRRSAQGRKALIPYLTAGYPDRHRSQDLMAVLAAAGGDILELGVPFSDPLADGPTIQRSSFHALREGMTLEGVLDMVAEFRARHDHPVVLFSYLNPILTYGVDRFVARAHDAGAQGLLLTDLPTGADPELEDTLARSTLDLIRLVAPTTPEDRLDKVVQGGSGFVYYISRAGVTGARAALRATLAEEVQALRSRVELPIAVGFGISTAAQARSVAGAADGVVVGSALIDALDSGGVDEAGRLMQELRLGMDSSQPQDLSPS